MRHLIIVITICMFSALAPTKAGAEPYASHNATRSVDDTLKEIEARGNWKSFSSGVMLNHPQFTSETEAITAIRERGVTLLCPEEGSTLSAGVTSGTTGQYESIDCRPGEYVLFLDEKPVFSLYCGNLVLDTKGIVVPVQEEQISPVVAVVEEKEPWELYPRSSYCGHGSEQRESNLDNLEFGQNAFGNPVVSLTGIPTLSFFGSSVAGNGFFSSRSDSRSWFNCQ